MIRIAIQRDLQLLAAVALVWFVAASWITSGQLVAQDAEGVDATRIANLTEAEQAAIQEDVINQLKTIGLALHHYYDVNKSLPAPAILSPKGNLLLSWRVAILPYLNEQALYNEFDLTQPWDSKKNLPLVDKMPAVFKSALSRAPAGTTVYLTPRGESTAFSGPYGINFRRIIDGTSNTIAVVEAADDLATPWTKPGDWPFNPGAPAAALGGHFPGTIFTLFCDGSVHTLENSIDKDVLRALFTCSGRESIKLNERNKWKLVQ